MQNRIDGAYKNSKVEDVLMSDRDYRDGYIIHLFTLWVEKQFKSVIPKDADLSEIIDFKLKMRYTRKKPEGGTELYDKSFRKILLPYDLVYMKYINKID